MFFSIAGAKLYIGGVISDSKGDMLQSDFAGRDWVEITGHENLGSTGDDWRELEFRDIRNNRVERHKGLRTGTVMELVFALDTQDSGQLALFQAEASRHNYAFRIVFDDAPENGTASERLFIARVGSFVEQYDSGDDIVKVSSPLWVNSNVVRIHAAEAVA